MHQRSRMPPTHQAHRPQPTPGRTMTKAELHNRLDWVLDTLEAHMRHLVDTYGADTWLRMTDMDGRPIAADSLAAYANALAAKAHLDPGPPIDPIVTPRPDRWLAEP